jgi:hypothetical protein
MAQVMQPRAARTSAHGQLSLGYELPECLGERCWGTTVGVGQVIRLLGTVGNMYREAWGTAVRMVTRRGHSTTELAHRDLPLRRWWLIALPPSRIWRKPPWLFAPPIGGSLRDRKAVVDPSGK